MRSTVDEVETVSDTITAAAAERLRVEAALVEANQVLESLIDKSVRSFAGVIGQGSYAFSEGAFRPQLLLGWSHEFADDPVTIGYGSSHPLQRHAFLMLPIRSRGELGCLQHLEADQPEQNDSEPREEKKQQDVPTAARRTHEYFAPPDGGIVRAIRRSSTGGVANSGPLDCG